MTARQAVTIRFRTLGDMIDHEHGLTVSCRTCRHSRQLVLVELARKIGRDFPLSRFHPPLFRCSACGSRDSGLTVAYLHTDRADGWLATHTPAVYDQSAAAARPTRPSEDHPAQRLSPY